MSAGRTGKPSGAARSTSKRHPPVASGQPDFRSARNRAYRERPSGEPDVRAPAMLEALAPRPRGGTVDTADLKSASGKPECRFESGRGHHVARITGWSSVAAGLARLCFDAVLPEHFMRTALWMIVLFAGLAWPAPDAPAQKNEGLGVLGPIRSSSSSSEYRGSPSRRSRQSAPTRRRARDRQDAGESSQEGEPTTEQPSDKK